MKNSIYLFAFLIVINFISCSNDNDTGNDNETETVDADSDGVKDSLDNCPNTPENEVVDINGCSESQKDDDNDGVSNNIDDCPNTIENENVDSNGCSESQKDDDNDGVTNNIDDCPDTESDIEVDEVGCPASNGTNLFIGSQTGVYVENNINYYGVTDILWQSIASTVNESFKFENNELIFQSETNSYSFAESIPNVKQEVIDYMKDLNTIIQTTYTFENDMMLWNGFKMTKPIYYANKAVMFPLKKINGEQGELDGVYESKLIYPDNDEIRARFYLDYQENGYVYVSSKLFLNNNVITEITYPPFEYGFTSPAVALLTNVDGNDYLSFIYGATAYQSIFRAHLFFKDIYQ